MLVHPFNRQSLAIVSLLGSMDPDSAFRTVAFLSHLSFFFKLCNPGKFSLGSTPPHDQPALPICCIYFWRQIRWCHSRHSTTAALISQSGIVSPRCSRSIYAGLCLSALSASSPSLSLSSSSPPHARSHRVRQLRTAGRSYASCRAKREPFRWAGRLLA